VVTSHQQAPEADVQLASTDGTGVRPVVPRRAGGFAGYSGNQAALRRLSRTAPRLQPKLTVGAVDDPLEVEADRVADQVMRMPDPALSTASPAALQRKCAGCEKEDDDEKVQRKEVQAPAADTIAGSISNVIQRQDADPQAASTGNQQASPTTNTQAGSTNAQSGSQAGAQGGANTPPPWSADIIDSGVQQIDSPQCFADAHGYSGSPVSGVPLVKALFSANCSAPCAKTPLRLRLLFHTDEDRIPRPGVKAGDKVSRVSAIAKFAPSGGGVESVLVQGQGDGSYVAPGYPLSTPFRTSLDFFTPPSAGTLTVSLINSDVFGTEALAIYSDQIPVQDCPNAQSGIPVPSTSIQTGRWLEVPDPVNAPLKYTVVDKNTPVEGPGVLAEVEKDENGYFYRYNGQKIYLPENPFSPQPSSDAGASQPSQAGTPQSPAPTPQ
jgi:hypothetical protein